MICIKSRNKTKQRAILRHCVWEVNQDQDQQANQPPYRLSGLVLFRCSAVCKWHNNTWQSRKCSSNKQCTARNSNEAIIQIFSWFLALPRLDCCKRRRRRAEGQHPVICEFLVSRFQKHLQAAPGLLGRTSYLVGVGRWPSLALICSLLLNEPHWNTTTCGGWWWLVTEGRWWCGKWVDWMSGSWNWECSWISPSDYPIIL